MRVDTPQLVFQAYSIVARLRLELEVERLGEVLPEVVRRAGLQRLVVLHQRLARVRAQRAGELLALGLQPVMTGIAIQPSMKSR